MYISFFNQSEHDGLFSMDGQIFGMMWHSLTHLLVCIYLADNKCLFELALQKERTLPRSVDIDCELFLSQTMRHLKEVKTYKS